MQLSVREAATLLGQSPRTVRARVARGDLPGSKKNGRWMIDRRDLPLTEAQRRALQHKADSLRRTLEEALPTRLARTPGVRSRSIADLEAFRRGAELLREIRGNEVAPRHARAEHLIESALLALAEAVHQFDGELKLQCVQRARGQLSKAAAILFLDAGEPPKDPLARWVVTLETEILPAVAGLARWAESLAGRRGR